MQWQQGRQSRLQFNHTNSDYLYCTFPKAPVNFILLTMSKAIVQLNGPSVAFKTVYCSQQYFTLNVPQFTIGETAENIQCEVRHYTFRKFASLLVHT